MALFWHILDLSAACAELVEQGLVVSSSELAPLKYEVGSPAAATPCDGSTGSTLKLPIRQFAMREKCLRLGLKAGAFAT